MGEVRIIVAGPVGIGKSAITGEIEIALRAIGVQVRFADEKAWQSEKNMTRADWQADLEMYQPTVVIEEQLWTERMVEAKVGGEYHMPDGRSFWIDALAAREIARRAVGTSQSSNDRLDLAR